MYRLMLYGLGIEVILALLFSVAGWLSFSPVHLLASLGILLVTSFCANFLFAKWTRAAVNAESVHITALLLFFLLDPSMTDVNSVAFLVLAAFLAQASKYVFAIGRKHIFNPVAISAVLLSLFGIPTVLWWVATPVLFPFVLIFGLMVAHKIRRMAEVGAFAFAAIAVGLFQGATLPALFLSWPLVFFGTMMLTEPRTAPAQKKHQIIFGLFVGACFSSLAHVGAITMTPELALVLGNLYAFFVNPKEIVRLTLQRVVAETEQIFTFVFTSDRKLVFRAGQYMEWTLPLKRTDSRGNRRYFTIASAPSESEVHLGVRIDRAHSSAFKQQLIGMQVGETLVASHVAGEFLLPTSEAEKMVWVAGGIGVTPFRSMIRELVQTNRARDVIMFYCINSEQDAAYREEFEDVCGRAGVKMHLVVAKPSESWKGLTGFLTKEIIAEHVPDYKDRTFFFSGPPMMVQNYAKLVRTMRVPKKQIKTDYFPGF